MQTDGASLYLLLCPGFVRAARERAEPRSLEGPSKLWPWMGAARPAGRDHGCLLETLSCLGGGKVLIWHLQVRAPRRLARGSAHTPFVVWVPCVTPTLLLPHRSPSVAQSVWMSPGATSIRWTCGCPRWLPRHMVQGVALSRLEILVFCSHKPGHLGKVFARTQTGKTSSWASHHLSVPLGTHVCDQSLHMRLGHHAAHSRAPGVHKESGQGSDFRVF